MSESLSATLELRRWQGNRGTYHLVVFTGEHAEAIAMHARLHRLEFGRQRGFGSVKVNATIGETLWQSSVFPQAKQSEWVLLVSQKVMTSEALTQGQKVVVSIELI